MIRIEAVILRSFYLLCFLCAAWLTKAQNMDSLRAQLPGVKGKQKVDLLTDLSFTESQSEPDSALLHAEQAAELARKINYTEGVASALYKMSIVYRYQGFYDKALQYGDSGLLYTEIDKAPHVRAGILANNGVAYRSKGKYAEALQAMQEAGDLFKKLDAESDLSMLLNNMGVLYMYMENYPKALEYYNQALEIQQELGEQKTLSNIYNNFAIVYANEGALDSALTYFQRSLHIEAQLGNLRGMSESINNIGAVYYYMGAYGQAVAEFRKSYAIDSTLGDVRGQIACMNNIAEIYTETGKPDMAIPILKKNLERARQIDSNADIETAYQNLANAYHSKSDFENAFSMLSNYLSVHDSVLGEARQEAIAELETRYETQQKEQKIKIQHLEIQENEASLKARQNLIFGLAGLILFLLTATLLGYRVFKSRKAVELQTAISREQARRLAAVIEATETERRRLASELHDGIGQQLSSIKLGLSNFINLIRPMSTATELKKIEKIQGVVDESARDVRNLSHQMMPKSLTEIGLEPALSDMFEKSLGLTGIAYEFDTVRNKIRLPEKIEINLYRIAQELVNNCIKHSGATRVKIELVETPRRVSFSFADNGKGIDPEKTDGQGILNIRTRVNHIGGEVVFLNSPEGGMHASVEVPLKTENTNR